MTEVYLVDHSIRFLPHFGYFLHSVYIYPFIVLSVGILIYNAIHFKDAYRKQAIMAVLGIVSSLLLAGIFATVLPALNIPASHVFSHLGTIMFIGFVAIAILKYRMMDIRVSLTETGSYILMVFLAILTMSVPYYMYDFSAFFSKLLYSFLFIFWTIFGLHIKNFLVTAATRAFIKGYYNANEIQKTITSSLVSAQKHLEVLNAISTPIQDKLELAHITTLLPKTYHPPKPSQSKFGFHITQFITKAEKPATESLDVEYDADLLSFFESKDAIEKFSDLPEAQQSSLSSILPAAKLTHIIPLRSDQKLEALLMVGPKLSEAPFYKKDLHLLESIQKQATVVFDRIAYQSQLEELNRSLEVRIKEAVKQKEYAIQVAQDLSHQANLAQMSKGIAHEIRNPVSAVISSCNLIRRFYLNSPKDREFNKRYLVKREELESMLGNDGDAVFEALVTNETIYEDGTFHPDNFLIYQKHDFQLPEELSAHKDAVFEYLVPKARLAFTLQKLETIALESDRVIRISEEMLKYGNAGKGIDKNSFANFMPQDEIDGLWQHLIEQRILNTHGMVTQLLDFNAPGLTLPLSDPYLSYQQAILDLLRTTPTAHLLPLHLSELVNRALLLFSGDLKESEISVETSLDDLPNILGHEDEVMSILTNIILNAIQAMKEKSDTSHTLTITATTTLYRDLLGRDTEGVKVTIQDTGCGIPKENLDTIQQAFFSTKDPTGGVNVGLGLSYVTRTIESLSGKIDITSEENRGTCVSLFFPVAS